MRKIDKLKNIQKANMLAEQRYLNNRNRKGLLYEVMSTDISLTESKKTEEQGLNILKKKGISDAEDVIKTMANGDKSVNQNNIPFMAFIYDGEIDLNNIIEVMNEYDELEKKKRIKPIQMTKTSLKIGDNEFSDFIKFSEFIHGETGKYAEKPKGGSNVTSDFVANKKPMWSGNNIDIYEGDNVGKCIAYTGGGLTGKSYRFCIGQPDITKNMYKSYRDSKGSTFYFIVDKNHFKTNDDGGFNLDDPLHIVVFDMTNRGIELTDANNTTGTIAEYGRDVNAYVNYLKSKGVPVEKLVNRPKTEQEKYENELFKRRNGDLDWFKNLDNPRNPNYRKPKLEPGQVEQNYYKSAYIGRGFLLSNDQFDYLNGK